jgi:hypothetical protein
MTGAALRRRAKQAKRATTSSAGCKDAEISEIAEPKISTAKGVLKG